MNKSRTRDPRRTTVAVARSVLALAFVIPAAAAAMQVPGAALGQEFQVNTTVQYDQLRPVVAINSKGAGLIAWISVQGYNSGAPELLMAQRYDESGAVVGGEFQIADHLGTGDGTGGSPAVAVAEDGSFAAVWSSNASGGSGVFVRRYAANGNALGPAVRVNSVLLGNDPVPQVLIGNDGTLVVFWYGLDSSNVSGVMSRRFAADGSALGPEVVVSSAGFASSLQLFKGPAGGYTTTWVMCDSVCTRHVRRYDASGNATSPDSAFPAGVGAGRAVMDQTGGFLVGRWDYQSVYAQRFGADGSQAGPVIHISDGGTSSVLTDLAMDAAGRWIATWTDVDPDSPAQGYANYARWYNADDSASSRPFQVDTISQDRGYPVFTSAALAANGTALISWDSLLHEAGSGYNGSGIFAQRFTGSENVDVRLVSSVAASSGPGGSNVAHSLTVTNTHPSGAAGLGLATGLSLDDTLPAVATVVGVDAPGWACSFAAHSVHCTRTGLDAGASSVVKALVSSSAGTSFSPSAAVAAREYDAAPTNNCIGTRAAVCDPPSTLNFASAATDRSESGPATSLVVQISPPRREPMMLRATFLGGPQDDYTRLTALPLLVPAGATEAQIDVKAIDDANDEPDQVATILLSPAAGAVVGAYDIHTLTIRDNDPPPKVNFNVPSSVMTVLEAATDIVLPVTLSAFSGYEITVPYKHSGTAIYGYDYTIQPLTLVPGANGGDLVVRIRKNPANEIPKTIQIDLQPSSRVTPGNQKTVVLLLVDQ